MLTLSVRNKRHIKVNQKSKIDELLESVGLKRNIVPKDGNSLFRCISQCVFLTQKYYLNVRQHLLQYANLQTEEFSQLTRMSVYTYEKKITDTKIDGELLDMHIAAKVYNINFMFYLDALPFMPLNIGTPDSVKTLNLCLNHEGTYDLVFTNEHVMNSSICQAIIYEMLYSHVFKLSNVQFAVKEMLFGRHLVSSKAVNRVSYEKRATCTNMKELIEFGITPFPYKVAKALTPMFYRNTEYDIWLNSKTEKFYGRCKNFEFKEGSKCLVLIGNQEYHCYIQHIRGENNPVEVYVENLAKKIDVDFNQLKLMSVEDDLREMDDSVQVSSSTFDRNVSQLMIEQRETPSYFNNPSSTHGLTTYATMSGQVFPSSYMNQYQQQPDISHTPINSTNNGNMVPLPWYMTEPPPLLSNEVISFIDRIVEPGASVGLNNTCIPSQNFDSLNVIGPTIQPISYLPWQNNDFQPIISCECVQCNNGEESGVAMNSYRVYQPWEVPKFDVPSDELQQ